METSSRRRHATWHIDEMNSQNHMWISWFVQKKNNKKLEFYDTQTLTQVGNQVEIALF